MQVPSRLAPRGNDLDVGIERVRRELEAHLVVALAGGAVGDGLRAGFGSHLHQPLGDQRPGDAGAEQVLAFVDRVGVEHGEYEVAHELLGEILHVDLAHAQRVRLLPRRFHLLALTDIGGESDYFGSVGLLQPPAHHRGVEAAGVGESDLVGHGGASWQHFVLGMSVGDERRLAWYRLGMEMNARFRGYLPVVLDLETGGFDRDVHAVLEIAALTLDFNDDRLAVASRHRWVVAPHPDTTVEAASLRVTGIDLEDPQRAAVAEGQAIRELFKIVRAEIKRQRCHRAIVTAHNAHFDHGFLHAAALRNGVKRSPFHPFSVIDTVGLAAVAYGHTVLSEACKPGQHRLRHGARALRGLRRGGHRQAALRRRQRRRQLSLAAPAALLTRGSSSPAWNISVMMSQPPTSSPSTYSCGNVGQSA